MTRSIPADPKFASPAEREVWKRLVETLPPDATVLANQRLIDSDFLRNTKQIHETFGPLAPTRMTSRGGEGLDVTFIASEDPLAAADDAVDILLDAGWHPGNIALLTTGSRHPVQVELTHHHGQVGYWKTYWEDEVFYGHVLGCKGLERPAVVLCANEAKARDRSREKLYVGMSRATDHLIVVGDPDVVRDIAGPAVAERLGIGALS